MAKIIRLTESDLTNIVRRVIEEQMNTQQDIDVQMKKIKPEMGGKYCFGDPRRMKSTYGNNVKLHKVKSGDTLSEISAKYPGVGSVDELIATNRSCQLSKGLKTGDVIAIVMLPSM
jgi:nucleoid-associated protein YgaU